MGIPQTLWKDPIDYLRVVSPVDPILFFSPADIQERARRFLDGFPGLVTYAVKANPIEAVIANLAAAGIQGFDVASPEEIAQTRKLAPNASLHYNNPVRARYEIAAAVSHDVASYSVDSLSELDKLIEMVPVERQNGQRVEISARFKLPVSGATYNFGAKFGATEDLAATLLTRISDAGFVPSLTFHPGTQCVDPLAWDSYIRAAKRICDVANVSIARLNVGGGFPSHRMSAEVPNLEAIFQLIERVTHEAFGMDRPALVCEPGRALCADAFALLARVKSVRDGNHVFLNDGIYGSMAEIPLMGASDRITVWSPDGVERCAPAIARTVFGPTCDSVDRLPGELALPSDLEEGDFVLIQGLGAYSVVTNTRFNGFGELSCELTLRLHP